ncbi:zinc-dependent alcohol dehydrogenase family protein [Leeuwenhoekiella marinoflava]|uniref:NADPH:quinone reductase-like Zn-dependent oxidoreductase n=2 Tax=Leeuwenhoekiella marinoflava TaxID=988 RepID=A0A4V1KSI1_9FLAO|nr:zinc-dependent alcohol dehydrogenase family protein [Leeuwenhoekiella marinoflava]RXG31818.1 NADPH:quinone reductase-like Zn-dependent oxidoreductase [Leeuwenhoekiella marinoflava]SHF04006.1 NADPH:quinone reductase [Leeuwenhoekiella marinoflava DSM 3653]
MDTQTKSGKMVMFNQVGGPEVLQLTNINVPAPASNEVRILVKAIGLNRVDLSYRQGVYSKKPNFPSKIGFEAAGIVESTGSDVQHLSPGDEVSVIGAFSNDDYGTYGNLILLPAYAVQRHPKRLSFQQAAGLWVSYLAAYGLLMDVGGLKKGQYVAINAASSSTGLAIIQTVKKIGGIPIAITTSSHKKKALLDAGASHVIISSEQDITAELLSITGNGVELVLDAVGGSQFEKLIAATAITGQLIVYGALSREYSSWSTIEVLSKKLTIRGFDMTELLMVKDKVKAAVAFIEEGVTSGSLTPTISKTFPLAKVSEAHRFMEENSQVGKVILEID